MWAGLGKMPFPFFKRTSSVCDPLWQGHSTDRDPRFVTRRILVWHAKYTWKNRPWSFQQTRAGWQGNYCIHTSAFELMHVLFGSLGNSVGLFCLSQSNQRLKDQELCKWGIGTRVFWVSLVRLVRLGVQRPRCTGRSGCVRLGLTVWPWQGLSIGLYPALAAFLEALQACTEGP